MVFGFESVVLSVFTAKFMVELNNRTEQETNVLKEFGPKGILRGCSDTGLVIASYKIVKHSDDKEDVVYLPITTTTIDQNKIRIPERTIEEGSTKNIAPRTR